MAQGAIRPNASLAVQAAVVALEGDETLHKGQVDACIAAVRRLLGLETLGAWSRWLADRGVSDEDVREETADYLENFIVMEQMARVRGIVVSDQDVYDQIDAAEQVAGGDMILMLDLADRWLADRGVSVAGVRSCLLRTALIDDVTHDISLPTDQEVVRFLKDRGVIRQKAKLHDVTENELHAGREELSAKRKSEAFDERLQGFRASIGIEIVRRSVSEER